MTRKRDPNKPVGPTPLVLEGEEKRDVQAYILDRISQGTFLTVICREEGMPARRTVSDWCRDDPEFGKAFKLARSEGFDVIAEQTKDIIDTVPQRIKTEHGDKVDPGHVQWLKNRADQHMKLLGKWDPRYAERLTQEHTGANGGPIIMQTTPIDEAL